MELARALLPADAAVVPREDPFWKRLEGTGWAQRSIVLRSANLELVSRELDPAILGRILCLGERAVVVLQHLLGQGQGSSARLDLRLHENKADYQMEQRQETGQVHEWMAGHYSPAENVSRFFVARERGETELSELEHVLVHELTHHYVEARWIGGEPEKAAARVEQPGFWIVEGLAEFVSGQVLEMDRRGERFDDAEVLALDAAVQVAGEHKLIAPGRLVELSQRGFWSLSDEPLAGIQLRHTLGSRILTERQVFYQESAALAFYLFNEAGPASAKALPEYLRAWYRNGLAARTWTRLGYPSSEELAAAFSAFLEARAKR
jgi:hypothetical protein